MIIRLVGVPFDGLGRRGGQDAALRVLRAAGLETALTAARLDGSFDSSTRSPRHCREVVRRLYFASVIDPVQSKFTEPSGLPLAVQLPLPFAPANFPVPPMTVHLLPPDCSTLSTVVPVNS